MPYRTACSNHQSEIRKLHEKIDHLLMHQWQRLMEIQQLQVSLMEQLSRNSSQSNKIN